MRVVTPIYVLPGKLMETSLDVSVCSQCNVIIGLSRKKM